jgi:hypothetical protein
MEEAAGSMGAVVVVVAIAIDANTRWICPVSLLNNNELMASSRDLISRVMLRLWVVVWFLLVL